MKKQFIAILTVLLSSVGIAQQLVWNGTAGNNNFFDELNWNDVNTNTAPTNGTLEPSLAINLDLSISNVTSEITANGIINLGSGSLTLNTTKVLAHSVSNGQITIEYDGYLELTNANALQGNFTLNLNDGVGWVKTTQLSPISVHDNHLNQILVNGASAVYGSNLRIDQYYFNGAVIRSNNLNTTPLTIYANENLQGTSANLSVDIIHSGANIPNEMNNNATSFLLKKGYMVTLADIEDGTGRSKNYIALEEDLIINALPAYLINNISFIRVLPWNWVEKKGRSGNITDNALNNTWFYRWNNTGDATLDLEYAPMAWGAGAANDDQDIEIYKNEYKATHILGFNEPDDCNAQSGQFNNLCQTDVAVGFYKNLMKTGLRMVSPAGREQAPFGWLKEFHDKCNEQDVRIDVIAVHWYDWGSNPQNSPNADANQIFNRFKNYLTNVYNLYGLPIWITEFNANPNRTNAVNYQFMQLALPYLESLDYVERYVWFQPFSGAADYYDSSGNLTNVGNFYANQVSTPAITQTTWNEDSNLDIFYSTVNPSGDNLIFNGFFETGDLTGWSGNNNGIINNANVYEGTTSGRILANTGSLFQAVEVEPGAEYNLSLFNRWFVAPSAPINIQIRNTATDAVIASAQSTIQTQWSPFELDFTVPEGVDNITFFVQKGASTPGWFVDNIVLLRNQTLSNIDLISKMNTIYPNPSNGIFNVKSNSIIADYKVYNIQGQVILQQKQINSEEFQIDLSGFKRGVFILNLKSTDGTEFTQKLIID
jgi:hypothetical protein